MFRVLVLGASALVVLVTIVTVSPILDGSIELEPFVASVQESIPQEVEVQPAPSCIISAHPAVISRGEEASIAWGSENAISASLSLVGAVPPRGGIYVKPLITGDYVLSVLSSTGEWSYCTTAIIVR